MASRPVRWLVLFFTRPIRLSDFSALFGRMKRSSTPIPVPSVPMPVAAVTEPMEMAPARPSRAPVRPAAGRHAGPSIVSSMFRPDLGIGVSEQPIDTLPAALRDELERPSTGRLQGSLRDA